MGTIGWMAFLAANPASAKDEFDPSSVKSAAIIGFGGTIEIEATETKSGIGVVDTVNQIKQVSETIDGLQSGAAKAGAVDDTVRAYTTIETGLESGFGWTVPSNEELAATPAYQQVAAGYTGQSKLAQMAAGWGAGMCPPGIVHWASISRMKQPERDALIDALGVDAVLVAQLTVTGHDQGVSVGGIGTSRVKPQASVRLSLYQKGEKKAVWTGFATGPKVDEAIKADFGSAADPSDAIVEAIHLGIDKLTEKYTGA
ncbi:MAG: hypothetical protein ABMB14_29445 [Myxococcota bacterium]